jgi:hypothetical protein
MSNGTVVLEKLPPTFNANKEIENLLSAFTVPFPAKSPVSVDI